MRRLNWPFLAVLAFALCVDAVVAFVLFGG